MDEIYPIRTLPPNLLKTHCNIFPSTPSSLCLPFRFSDQNLVCNSRLSHACYMSAHITVLGVIGQYCLVLQFMKLLILQFSPNPITSCLLLVGRNSLLRALFSDTPSYALPLTRGTSLTPIQNRRQSYSFACYILISLVLIARGKKRILK